MTPGIRIKALREQNKISQTDLANKIGVSPSSVSMWETNRREICQNELIKLSNLFNVSIDYILGTDNVLNNIDIAFYNQLGELTQEQKQDVIRYAQFVRSKNAISN